MPHCKTGHYLRCNPQLYCLVCLHHAEHLHSSSWLILSPCLICHAITHRRNPPFQRVPVQALCVHIPAAVAQPRETCIALHEEPTVRAASRRPVPLRDLQVCSYAGSCPQGLLPTRITSCIVSEAALAEAEAAHYHCSITTQPKLSKNDLSLR